MRRHFKLILILAAALAGLCIAAEKKQLSQSEKLQAELEETVRKALPSVVCVKSMTDTEGKYTEYASGFIISEKGDIITNSHLLEKGRRFEVRFHDGTSSPAVKIKSDDVSDIALIKVEGRQNLHPLKFDASGKEPANGSIAISISASENSDYVMSVHVLRHPNLIPSRSDYGTYYRLYGIINKFSIPGAPLLNLKGELLGMNDSFLPGLNREHPENPDISFAIPSAIIREFFETKKQSREQAPLRKKNIENFGLELEQKEDAVFISNMEPPTSESRLKPGVRIHGINKFGISNLQDAEQAISLRSEHVLIYAEDDSGKFFAVLKKRHPQTKGKN